MCLVATGITCYTGMTVQMKFEMVAITQILHHIFQRSSLSVVLCFVTTDVFKR